MPDPGKLMELVEWRDADLLDECGMREHLEGAGTVYHTAAMVSFNPRDYQKMISFNTQSTRILVNLSLEMGVERFGYVSSVSTLGIPLAGEPATENLIGAPDRHRSGYAVSKFGAENEVWRGMAEGLNAVIVNPSVIIGPGNWTRSSARFFPAVWKGLKYYTGGGTGFVDVRDVSRAMVALINKGCYGERFILSAGELSYKELFGLIANALGKNPPEKQAPSWLLHTLWRMEYLRTYFTGKEPLITSETAAIAKRFNRFSSRKIRDTLRFDFRPLEETIREVAGIFMEDVRSGYYPMKGN